MGNWEEADEIYVNPSLWDEDYARISAVASFFGAQVVYNEPARAVLRSLIKFEAIAAFGVKWILGLASRKKERRKAGPFSVGELNARAFSVH